MSKRPVSQATAAPTAKVTGAGASGAVVLIAVWAVGLVGLEVPPEVASAATLLVAAGAAYLVRDRVQVETRHTVQGDDTV